MTDSAIFGGGYKELNSTLVETGRIVKNNTIRFPLGFIPKDETKLRIEVSSIMNNTTLPYAYTFTPFILSLQNKIEFELTRDWASALRAKIIFEYDSSTKEVLIGASLNHVFVKYRVFELA